MYVDVPYTDTSADALSFSLHADARPGVVHRIESFGAVRVRMAVLGASHQVVVEHRGATLIETVACDLPGGPLPAWADDLRPPFRHRFESEIARLSPREFATACGSLLASLDEADGPLVLARFPSVHQDPAVTAIVLDRVGRSDEIGWRTWHTYPGVNAIVATASRTTVDAPVPLCR